MRIVVLCEGRTEQAIKKGLRGLLCERAGAGPRPGLQLVSLGGHMKRDKLRRLVELHVAQGDVAGVVTLTDVYPNYRNADEATRAIEELVGSDHSEKLRVHAAQYELEAWLIPHWEDIARWLGVSRKPPARNPEDVNNENPPSKHIKALYDAAKGRRLPYDNVSSAERWLTSEGLRRSATECPNLKAFLNSLLHFAGLEPLP